ncbi:hypothetical protein [Massilia aquatica]|uniref:Uncharacterized protein n=1 Tax=Massilia aquatica TaxID=2609000 RepID=A0ABX0M3N5_9BURK|nr:hypothetical protein [Massilia aquatica]NHZ41818.1 hypothetical protein [Massilia aquatica]
MSMLLFRQGMSGSRQLVNLTFYSNTTWPCPATTTRIVSLVGQGSSGTAQSSAAVSTYCTEVTYINDGQFPEGLTLGNYGWWSAWEDAEYDAAARLNNGGGAAGFYRTQVTQYSHPNFGDKYRLTSTLVPYYDFVPGSAYITYNGVFPQNGEIRNSASAVLNSRYTIPATNGAPASAFGRTFPGGVGGPANQLSDGDFAVAPGQPYPIGVPPGGWVSLSYYQ